MVQAPGFLTFAAQLVRTLWSRSVAVIVSRSPVASKRKFERIGLVVLRSTTDCAAVSSRNSSARETVISRLPVGAVVVISGSWLFAVSAVAVVKAMSPGGSLNWALAKLYTEYRAMCISASGLLTTILLNRRDSQ
jgi:hypothetical protein